MCEKFLIHVHFKEIAISNVREDLECKEISLNFELPKVEVESKFGDVVTFQNGSQEIDALFILQSEDMIDNEDFMISCFGNNLIGSLLLNLIVNENLT